MNDDILLFFKDLKHHVYILESLSLRPQYLESIIPKDSFEKILSFSFSVFKIDDIPQIRSIQNQKTENGKLIIIELSSATQEAQNALLKMIEEPQGKTKFIFIIPSRFVFLETLRSRSEIIKFEESFLDEQESFFNVFISGRLIEQLEEIKRLIDTDSFKQEQRRTLFSFLTHFEIFIRQKPEYKNFTPFIWKARSFIDAQGASSKLILESLALEFEIFKKKKHS